MAMRYGPALQLTIKILAFILAALTALQAWTLVNLVSYVPGARPGGMKSAIGIAALSALLTLAGAFLHPRKRAVSALCGLLLAIDCWTIISATRDL